MSFQVAISASILGQVATIRLRSRVCRRRNCMSRIAWALDVVDGEQKLDQTWRAMSTVSLS